MATHRISLLRFTAYASLMAASVLATTFAGCNRETEPNVKLPKNESLRFSAQPIIVRKPATYTSQPLNNFEQTNRLFNDHLQQLAEFADNVRTGGKWPEIPNIFADQFETSFIERNKLQSRFLGERIRIARWQLSDQTPTYYETIALRRLFRTLLEPWREASPFRIEFKIHTITRRPNYYDAVVIVDVVGNVDSRSVRSTGVSQQIGRSATGIWQISWEKTANDSEPRIKRIDIVEHDETVNYIDHGTLFQDCTKSVLRNDESVQKSLSYGLDQWNQRIPGIDVLGNNGLAIGDVNNDGLDDVYVCQPHGIANLLLIQNPDGTADNKAADAGVDFRDNSTAALIVDIDNDRMQDLVVATDSRLVLLSNAGQGNFQLEHKMKIGHSTDSLSAADFDQDGDLDLLLSKYRPVAKFDDIFAQPNAWMSAINGGRNVLLRNDEAWEFKDVTGDVGMAISNQQYTRAAIWLDFDLDGDQDLFFANEFNQDSLFENRDGWFRETTKPIMSKNATNSATSSIGDFDRNGIPDLFVATDSSFNARRITQDYISAGGQYLREANGYGGLNRIYNFHGREKAFTENELASPALSSESSYSSVVADFNNDSEEDIALTNGWLTRGNELKAEAIFYSSMFDPGNDLENGTGASFQIQHEISDLCREGDSFNGFQRNRCFMSIGNGQFNNYSNSSGIDFLDDARAIGSTDWDGDGDIDLIITNRTAPRLRILQNRYPTSNQFLQLHLLGTTSNRDAIGSRVEVFLDGEETPLVKSLSAGSGRCSQSSKKMHFGLGKGSQIEKVIVHWPNGNSQTYEDLLPNKTYRLVEGEEEAAENTNDRFRIALDTDAIKPSEGTPDTNRIRFFPTTRLPILQYRSFGDPRKQKWYQIENVNSRPLFCIFCSNQADNSKLMSQWNLRDRNIEQLNADILLVFTGNYSDTDAHVKKSLRQVEEADLKFRWGVLSESSNAKLAMLFGQWFFKQSLPDDPFAILLDGEGNVHFAYSDQELTWKNVEPDLVDVCNRNYVLNQIPNSDQSNWIEKRRTPRFDRLRHRFDEIGYERDAKAYEQYEFQQQSVDYLNRGIDLASKGSLTSAISAVERSRELDPNSVEALIELAEFSRRFALTADQQTRTRMFRTAGEVLDEALQLEPNNVDAILARAEIFRLQKDIENALSMLLKYLKIDPECWRVHAIVGRLFFHKRQYVEAAQYLIAAIENRPTLPYVAGDLGYLYLRNDQYGDAAEFLDLATRLQPSEPDLKRHLAEAEFWKGNFEKSGQLFEETVKSQPKLSHPKQMLAWLKGTSPFASFRDGKTGLEIIQPFVDVKGDTSPSSLEIKAACLAEEGDFDQALVIQKRALDVIENRRTIEKYSPKQLAALRNRVELYKRRQVYRMKDTSGVPLKPLGRN